METKKEEKIVGEKLGVAGFTLGITGIALVLFSPFAGILCAIVALVFCIIQRKRNKTAQAKVGLILGIIGIVINIGYIIAAVYWILPYLQQQGL